MKRRIAQGVLALGGIGLLGLFVWGAVLLGAPTLIAIGVLGAIGLLMWAFDTLVDDIY